MILSPTPQLVLQLRSILFERSTVDGIVRIVSMHSPHSKSSSGEEWVLRVNSPQGRHRLELNPEDTYQAVLQQLALRLDCQPQDLEVYSSNGRRLHIAAQRRLKDVVYLSHGSMLQVNLARQPNRSPSPQPKVPQERPPCLHSSQMRCLNCPSSPSAVAVPACDHGPSVRCLKCVSSPKKSTLQENQKQKSPEPVAETPCRHRPNTTCPKCVKPERIRRIVLLRDDSPPKAKPVDNPEEGQPRPCTHGPEAKCINCLEKQQERKLSPNKNTTTTAKPDPPELTKENEAESVVPCEHPPGGRCTRCIAKAKDPPFLSFDEFLARKRANCKHSRGTCVNCLPPRQPRLFVNKQCKRHAPYPEGLCSQCVPQSVTVKTQQFRHVDYVQFMNGEQLRDFISYWVSQKNGLMRVAFAYGYFAEDPFFPQGIRAVVEALYQPHQYCTPAEFYILDSQQRQSQVAAIASALGLERIGIVLATPTRGETPFTEAQVRMMARLQERESLSHSTGYRFSNFFTVVVRQREKDQPIEPEVFMVSDQGQCLQQAGLLEGNLRSPFKVRVRRRASSEPPGPQILVAGKQVEEFQVQYLLVKVAAGLSRSNKFAILKSNCFPPSSRGPVKVQQLREYMAKTRNQAAGVRLGDFNLLVFVGEAVDAETGQELALAVAQERRVQHQVVELVDSHLKRLV